MATVESSARIDQRPAAEIAAHVDLGPDARALLSPTMLAEPYLAELAKRGLLLDGIRFLAQALDKRSSVWWACGCVRASFPDPAPAGDPELIELAEQWVREGGDERGRAAFEAASRTTFKTPACWAAVAAFWSGSTIAPPGAPVVPPAPGLTAKAVSGAVLLAAAQGDPRQIEKRQRAFLERGLAVASGKIEVPGSALTVTSATKTGAKPPVK